MVRSVVENSDLARCLLCHNAPCAAKCPSMDPARLLRSLRFQNQAGAALRLPQADVCADCAAPCEAACPTQVPIARILTCLRAGRPHFEPAPGAESVDLSCDLFGVTLENPFFPSRRSRKSRRS